MVNKMKDKDYVDCSYILLQPEIKDVKSLLNAFMNEIKEMEKRASNNGYKIVSKRKNYRFCIMVKVKKTANKKEEINCN